jgi:hypothetical protein
MKLELIRKEFTDVSTIGDLSIDGKFFSYTLEDCVRDVKIPGETAIPYGTYEVITNFSNRFKKVMPYIKDVPGFEGVRIHSGNYAGDTEGCILVGYTSAVDFVGLSRAAFDDFFGRLTAALNNDEKVWLTINKEA